MLSIGTNTELPKKGRMFFYTALKKRVLYFFCKKKSFAMQRFYRK